MDYNVLKYQLKSLGEPVCTHQVSIILDNQVGMCLQFNHESIIQQQSLHFVGTSQTNQFPTPKTVSDCLPSINLYKESKGITINLSLLNQTSTKVVGSSPSTEITNVLRVQTDGLSTNFVQLIISKGNFGCVYGR